MVRLLSSFVLPDKTDFSFGASYGLVSLQEFHDFDHKKIARGTKHKNWHHRVFLERVLICWSTGFLVMTLMYGRCNSCKLTGWERMH